LALQAEIKNLRKAKKNDGKPFLKKPFEKKAPFKWKKYVPPKAPLEKPNWFFKEPKEDEPWKPKTWKDKLWYYCSPKTGGKCDGQYRHHKPTDCKGKAHHFDASKNKRKQEESPNEDRKLKLAKAYQATLSAAKSSDELDYNWQSATWQTRDTLPSFVLKIWIYYMVYIALFFSQVIYTETYEPIHPTKPRRKRSKLSKWFDPMKEWLIMKVKVFVQSIEIWSQTNKGQRRMQWTQSIATQRNRPDQMTAFMAYTAVAMQASGSGIHENTAMFDTNLAPVGVDNWCTGCISNKVEDFVGPLVESNISIKVFGGSRMRNIMIGTLSWKWQADEGRIHKFLIPKLFYVKEGNVRLLSPQHWAQMQGDTKPKQGTGSETDTDKATLFASTIWQH
jgi:hypothetical protein